MCAEIPARDARDLILKHQQLVPIVNKMHYRPNQMLSLTQSGPWAAVYGLSFEARETLAGSWLCG